MGPVAMLPPPAVLGRTQWPFRKTGWLEYKGGSLSHPARGPSGYTPQVVVMTPVDLDAVAR